MGGRGGGWGKMPFGFRRGLRPGTSAARAYGSAQRGKESVAYRLARAGRVQPRGCKGRSPLHEITLVSPSPEGKGRGMGAKHPSVFAEGSAPGTPAAGAYGSAQGGKESVAYRLARAVRVQPRGCKGRSPLHEITLVSPSPMGGRGGGMGAKRPLVFAGGLARAARIQLWISPSCRLWRDAPVQVNTNSRKVLGGLGDSFKSPPASLQRLSPPAIAEVQFFRKVVPSLVSTSVTPRSER